MNESKIIPFDPAVRLLEKAEEYIASPEIFLKEREQAVPLLLKALKWADSDNRRQIILLLGSFAGQEAVQPMYEILTSPEQDEDLRHMASVQLSVILPMIDDPQSVADHLMEDLKNPDPEIRIYAAFALGWEGNYQAAIPLIECLYDLDTEVQQSAVHALSNLRDDRIFSLLIDRLAHGSSEQQKSILYNLWQFDSKKEDVLSVYLEYLDHKNPELRFDALALLDTVSEPEEQPEAYRKCLDDSVPRIRVLALERLEKAPEVLRAGFKAKAGELLSDPAPEVRQAALRFLGTSSRHSAYRKC